MKQDPANVATNNKEKPQTITIKENNLIKNKTVNQDIKVSSQSHLAQMLRMIKLNDPNQCIEKTIKNEQTDDLQLFKSQYQYRIGGKLNTADQQEINEERYKVENLNSWTQQKKYISTESSQDPLKYFKDIMMAEQKELKKFDTTQKKTIKKTEPNLRTGIIDSIVNKEKDGSQTMNQRSIQQQQGDAVVKEDQSKNKEEVKTEPSEIKKQLKQDGRKSFNPLIEQRIELPKEKILQTNLAMRISLNKKILNQVVYNKMARKKIVNRNSMIVDQNLQLQQQLNLTNPEIEGQQFVNLFQNIDSRCQDSIQSFKEVNSIMRNHKNLIDYKEIEQKLIENKRSPKKLFDLKDELKKIEELSMNYDNLEKMILEKYNECTQEIKDRKKVLTQYIFEGTNLYQQIIEINEAIKKIKIKFKKLDEQICGISDQNKFDLVYQYKIKQMAEIQQKLEKFRIQKEYQISLEKNKINEIMKNYEIVQNKIRDIESEIQQIKYERMQLKQTIKKFYKNLIKNDLEKFKYSIVRIMKVIKYIKDQFYEEEFPQFLDKASKSYLFQIAHLEYEIEKRIEKKQVKVGGTQQEQQQQHQIDLQNEKNQHLLQNYLRFQSQNEYTKERLAKLKKGDKYNNFQWKSAITQETDENNSSQEISANKKKSVHAKLEELIHNLGQNQGSDQSQKNYQIMQEIQELNQKKQEMEENEKKRLYQIYLGSLLQAQNNEEKINQRLIQILQALFGQRSATEIFTHFKLKSKEYIVNQNKYEDEQKLPSNVKVTNLLIPAQFTQVVSKGNSETLSRVGTQQSHQTRSSQRIQTANSNSLMIPGTAATTTTNTSFMEQQQYKNQLLFQLIKEKKDASANKLKRQSMSNQNFIINYRYDPIYNKIPELQNTTTESTFLNGNNANNIQMTLTRPQTQNTSQNIIEKQNSMMQHKRFLSNGQF